MRSDDKHQPLALASDVVLQIVEGEALLLKLHDETVFALNDTGARVAQLIDGRRSLHAIVETLSREYNMAAELIGRDVSSLVDALRARGLVVASSREEEA